MPFIHRDEMHVLATFEGNKILRSEPITEDEFARLTKRGLTYGLMAFHQFSADWQKVLNLPLAKRNLVYELETWALTNQTISLSKLKQCGPGELLCWYNRMIKQDYRKMSRKRRAKMERKAEYCILYLVNHCLKNGLVLKQDNRDEWYFMYA